MTIENDDSVFLATQFSFFLFRVKFAHLLSNSVNEINEDLSVSTWNKFSHEEDNRLSDVR